MAGFAPELLEDRDRAAHQGRIITFSQGTGLLIGATQLLPGSGSPDEVAGDLQRVWFGQIRRSGRPARRLATAARRIRPGPSDSHALKTRSRTAPASSRARVLSLIQQGRFGARGADRPQPQQFPGAVGQRQCLVERLRSLGTATASATPAPNVVSAIIRVTDDTIGCRRSWRISVSAASQLP